MSKNPSNSKKHSFEELLRENGYLIFTANGNSMKPLFTARQDIIEIHPVQGKLKKYDVVLYKRKGHPPIYVLHRLVGIQPDGKYIIAGDNNTFKEYDVTDKDILGVMTKFIHNGKSVYVSNPLYILYCIIWVGLFPIRVFFRKCKKKIKGHVNK